MLEVALALPLLMLAWFQQPAAGLRWPYLALAYQPLSDEEMQAYQVFSEAPEGRALNAALFAAFDASFVRISGELGRAVALMVQGQDI